MFRGNKKTYKSLYGNGASHTRPSRVNSIFLVLAVLAIAFFVFNVVGFSAKLLIAVLAVIVFVVAFVNTEFALILLIFSMLLSPELEAGVAGRRAVVLRADDIFLGVVILGWFARMAVHKELAVFKSTPLNGPIAGYVAVCIISTLFASINGNVSALSGFFFTLKYIEYFFLYFMVSNIIQDKRQIKVFIYLILLVSFIISIYAFFQHYAGVVRVSAPFEGDGGEANTLGGYLVFTVMIACGLLFNLTSFRLRVLLSCLVAFSLSALMFTLSRGSWLAVVPAFIVLFVLSRKGRFIMFFAAMFVFLSAAWLFPKEVKDRFAYTFEEQVEYNVFGKRITLDESAAARIDAWAIGFKNWKRSPIIGNGVASPGPVVDNQYTRTLSETGMVGFIFFCVIIGRIFREAYAISRTLREDKFFYGLTCGFIAGAVGILFHSLSAASFIIIRIIEPFWFMAALVLSLPKVLANENQENQSYAEVDHRAI